MGGKLRWQLLAALTILPLLVAAILAFVTIRLYRQDKELSVFDLSTQSADLVARILEAKLQGLKARAMLQQDARPPLLALRRSAAGRAPAECEVALAADRKRLTIRCGTAGGRLEMDVLPSALLDLKGLQGPTDLAVINARGELLVHSEGRRRAALELLAAARSQGKIFAPTSGRIGARELQVGGRSLLVAHARAAADLAVLQSVPLEQVMAAATPLITTAAAVAGGTALAALLLGLLISRRLMRTVERMVQHVQAIGRGEFGRSVEIESRTADALIEGLNEMSAALERREEELQQSQQQLISAERLNTAGRMINAIVHELSKPLQATLELAGSTIDKLPDNSEAKVWQREIVHQVNQAASMLGNLQKLASRQEELPRDFDVAMLLADTLMTTRAMMAERALTVSQESFHSATVHGRPEQLRNALLDLFLFVAKQAWPNSRVSMRLSQIDSASDALVELEYEGLPVKEQAHERFISQEGSEGEGEGMLELAVATMVIQELGGSLEVETRGGTNLVQLTIPRGEPGS